MGGTSTNHADDEFPWWKDEVLHVQRQLDDERVRAVLQAVHVLYPQGVGLHGHLPPEGWGHHRQQRPVRRGVHLRTQDATNQRACLAQSGKKAYNWTICAEGGSRRTQAGVVV